MRAIVTNFLKDAFEWLADEGVESTWSLATINTAQNGQKSYTMPAVPDIGYFLARHLADAPCYVDFAKALEGDKVYTTLRDTSSSPHKDMLSSSAIAHALLMTHMHSVPRAEVDRDFAEHMADNLAESIARGVFVVRKWSPLEGFICEVDHIDCGNGYVIRRMSDEEAYRLASGCNKFPPGCGEWKFCLEWTIEFSFNDEHPAINEWQRLQSPIVPTLRLLGPGHVGVTTTRSIPDKPGAITLDTGQMWTPETPVCGSAEYKLSKEGAADLSGLIKLVAAKGHPNSLHLALERVRIGAERRRLEDTFLDHIVALEALYGDSTDGLPGGLSYKVGFRLAMFLYHDPANRRDAFSKMKAAQRARGALVHGTSNLQNLKGSERAAVIWAGDAARASVRKMLIETTPLAAGYFDDLIFTMK